MAKQLNVLDNIIIIPPVYQKEKLLLLKSSDIIVIPSITESFSIVALEGMVSGLPQLASKVGGLKYVVQHKRTGFTMNPNDPYEWSCYIRMLFENPKLRKKLSANSKKIAKRYRWSCIIKKLINIYNESLQNKRPLGR